MFPTELLLLIFQQFNSKRYLTECSTVCKQWYAIASDSSFYEDINIYTVKQLELFIDYATNKQQLHHQSQQQKPIGHFVNRIHLLFCESISNQTLLNLQQCCPFIKEITFLNDHKYIKGYFYSWENWHYLKELPIWLSIASENDTTTALKTLQPFNSNNNATLVSLSLITNFQIISRLNLFPTSILSFLQKLNFSFNFSKISLFYIDMIHMACPHLKKISITEVTIISNQNDNIIINNNNNNNNNNEGGDINDNDNNLVKYQHWENINHLQFKSVTIEDKTFFTKILHSYPNLKSLFLEKILTNSNVSAYLRHNHFHDFIGLDDLSKLKHLKISFHYKDSTLKFLGPVNGFSQWLNNHPQQLKTLEMPIHIANKYNSINDIDNNDNDNNNYIINPNRYHQQTSSPLNCIEPLKLSIRFLKYLNTLILCLPNQPSSSPFISDINNNNKNVNQSISTCLKSLTVYRTTTTSIRSLYFGFNLFNWLHLFPSLTSLKLKRIPVLSDTRPSSNNNKDDNEKRHQHVRLKELIFRRCTIRIDGGLSYLCQQCPNIEILHMDNTNMYYYPQLSIKNSNEKGITVHHHPNITILYAPNHIFKEIIFNSSICYPLNHNFIVNFKDFTLNTSSSLSITKRDKYFSDHGNYRESVHMCMIIHSIDKFQLNGTWIVY